jgi:probable HAF family extracellular repeat protein
MMNIVVRTIIGVVFLGHLIFAGIGTVTAAEEYTVTDLGTLGESWSSASGMNSDGQVVGSSSASPSGAKHAFLWTDGVIVDLGTPPGYSVSQAASLNDLGQVVGSTNGQYQSEFAYLWENGNWNYLGTLSGLDYSSASDINNSSQISGYSFMLGPGGGYRAWIYDGGILTDLGTFGGDDSLASAINELGQVTGWAQTADPGVTHAFIWENGVMTDLGVLPGETSSTASDINILGQVCGQSAHTSSTYPFSTFRTACLWKDGNIIDIGKLPGYTRNSTAGGINDQSQVVGYSSDNGNKSHAFIFENGVLTDLNDLIAAGSGWMLEVASDINESGEIVGYGKYNGEKRAFLLEPLPEHPAPDIKIDGQDGPLTIPSTQTVSVTVSLDPGNQGGVNHDWWILAKKSGGSIYSWVWPGTLHSGILRAYAGPLFMVDNFTIHNGTFPLGTWTVAFAVDELNNSYEGTYEDTISVTSY